MKEVKSGKSITKPMVPKVGVKPKSIGGKRYGCGGKLK